MKNKHSHGFYTRKLHLLVRSITVLAIVAYFIVGPHLVIDNHQYSSIGLGNFLPTAHGNSTYANLASGNLSFSVTPSNINQITSNDNWSGVPSVEGYFGQGLSVSHGVDPQTVVGSEFPGNGLPRPNNTQINANKGNPSAYNAGGVTEFDSGPFISIGLQGNVQANPYLVFYVNTTNRGEISISYEVTDIDGGSNNSVSPLALQYRVGETGAFTNVPTAFVPDATDGPNLSGRVTTRSVLLPSAVNNQPQVQLRLITTNAAGSGGASTPDEWIGINNVVISSFAPTAAHTSVSGRVFTWQGRPISRAVVRVTDQNGRVLSAVTNMFGYYSFSEIVAGSTYIFEVASKGSSFDPQVLVVVDELHSVDFFATP